MTIDILPDVALLTIFEFYVDEAPTAWRTLAHVCRNWRYIVFGSPRRLNLRLYCTASTPVKKLLGVWPLFPIVVCVDNDEMWDIWGEKNIIAALKHKDRICAVDLLFVPNSKWGKFLAAMQQPFPELTRLQLMFEDDRATPVIPSSFLGGSAPRLQTFILHYTTFPGLPNLLLSATHLLHLDLWGIPPSGYISPEAMVTCLSSLTNLERLIIHFQSSQSRPDRSLPPQKRILLPVLTKFRFKGFGIYLGDLVAQIDTPLLNELDITFSPQLVSDTPQLTDFISRTPNVKAHDEARLVFANWHVSVTIPETFEGAVDLGITYEQSYWQLLSLAQVCGLSSLQALISPVERLYVLENIYLGLRWQDDTESSRWLELFRPFTNVKGLYISEQFGPHIVSALQELVGERVTEVLPTLQTLFLEVMPQSGPVQEAIGQFVSARQLSGHPIVVSRWERKWD